MLHGNPGLEAKRRGKAADYLVSGKLMTVALKRTKDPRMCVLSRAMTCYETLAFFSLHINGEDSITLDCT